MMRCPILTGAAEKICAQPHGLTSPLTRPMIGLSEGKRGTSGTAGMQAQALSVLWQTRTRLREAEYALALAHHSAGP
jgi:hypothetical protein